MSFRKLFPTLLLCFCALFLVQTAKADSVVLQLSPNNFGQAGSLGTVTLTLLTAGPNIGDIQVDVAMAAGYIIHGAGAGFNVAAGFTGIDVGSINPAAFFAPDLTSHTFDGYGSFAYSVASNQSTSEAQGTNTNAVSFIVDANENFTTAAQITNLALQVAPLAANGDTGFVTTSPVVGPTPLITPTPEPASMILLGTGLISLSGFARKKFRNRRAS
jgi:hypothetical protein